jgi:hypothetical protein
MCLTCGCMDAHKVMTKDDVTYEDVKRAADQNGVSVEQVLTTIGKTVDQDRSTHPAEYAGSKKS